ncbi:MAG: IS21 family transposase, partial [Proteobacteria bacterium]|nr:IS21 family transposase [Pseudomonadota bacterium]
MSNKKRVCRLILTTALSNRAIADQSNNSHNTIGKYRKTLREAGLAWNDIQSLDDEEIERLLNPGGKGNTKYFVEPEWSQVHEDLAKPHVNLTMLHEEYLDVTPEDFMSEREFRRRYKKYARTLGIVLRKPRLPGENMEVDYSGKRPHIQDEAGNQVPVELFVAIIGASTRG